MTDDKRPLTPGLQRLSEAVRAHSGPVRVVFCGFDLWIEVMGSGHTSMCNFRMGGQIADGSEPENTVIVPVTVIGGRIVVSFDPTLAPDGFTLKG